MITSKFVVIGIVIFIELIAKSSFYVTLAERINNHRRC